MNASYDAARNQVALLDLDADGRIRVGGAGAQDALNACFSMDLELVLPWRGVTGLFLDEAAGIRAIATVFRGDEDYFVFTEAATAASLLAYLRQELSRADVEIEDLALSHGCVGVLGPKAQAAMSDLAGEEILGLPYLAFEENGKLEATLFRMGFCGEFEYRILCARERCQHLTDHIHQGGQPQGLRIARPEVMEVLMLEMRSLGIADIPSGADPIQCGLHWMVNFRKPHFVGRAAVMAAKATAPQRALMVLLEPSATAHPGDRLVIEGQDLGHLVHVAHSPQLQRDIALAYVTEDLGFVGVSFNTAGANGACLATGVSAPLFVTKTVSAA